MSSDLLGQNLLDLRTLRFFVTVAEEEHVGRAAARLHISQSPLSRQIRKLEDDLGLSLFLHEKQRLRLTQQGRWLLGEARALLAHAARLEHEALHLAQGRSHVVVGFVRTAIWSGILTAALRELRASRPDVHVELRPLHSSVQVAALARGEIGVGLVHSFSSTPGLVATCVLDERDVLLLPRDHPLAAARALAPKDLDGQPWIAVSQGRERFVASCAGAGFVPNVAYGAPDTATVLGMVEAGAGLAILPRCVSGAASANVVVRELGWLPFVTRLHAVCPAQGASAAATQLMALLAKRAPGAAAKPRQGRRARST